MDTGNVRGALLVLAVALPLLAGCAGEENPENPETTEVAAGIAALDGVDEVRVETGGRSGLTLVFRAEATAEEARRSLAERAMKVAWERYPKALPQVEYVVQPAAGADCPEPPAAAGPRCAVLRGSASGTELRGQFGARPGGLPEPPPGPGEDRP